MGSKKNAAIAVGGAVEAAFRREHGRLVGWLGRWFGLDLAEEAVQDAFAQALVTWSAGDLPERPGAWLARVARNAAIDRIRRAATRAEKLAELARVEAATELEEQEVPDERLGLIATCCHPALPLEGRVALTLQLVCGLDARTIARLFLLPEATVAQRLVRAKHKIRAAAIPFRVPDGADFDERLESMLAVIYLLFTEGYASRRGEPATRPELCDEAIRLGRLLCHLAPGHGEARALLALMLLQHARHDARYDEHGQLVPLEEQDRGRWDASAVREGLAALAALPAAAAAERGPLWIQAAIAAHHAAATSAADTDWHAIVALYGALSQTLPSPAVTVALAVAEGMAHGPERGLARLERAAGGLAGFDRLEAARAELLRRAGRWAEACAAFERATARARGPLDRAYFERRRRECAAHRPG